MINVNVEISGVLPTGILAAVAEREYSQALKDAGDWIAEQIKDRFESEAINATELTSKAIKAGEPFLDSLDRQSIEVGAFGDRERLIWFIEHGRKPGKMPPVDQIIEWMGAKGIGSGLDSPQAIEALAWSIARSIASYGTKGHHVFERITKELENDSTIIAIFQAATDRIIAAANQ